MDQPQLKAGGGAARAAHDLPIVPLAGAPGDLLTKVHQLNQLHWTELSALNEADLLCLIEGAFYASALGSGEAFLLAFDQHAQYASPNFIWFKKRFERFVYVDRLAVSPAFRGRGLARRLYSDLFSAASSAGQKMIACEINLDPPNAASDALHASLGFIELGSACLANGKIVRYLGRMLEPGNADSPDHPIRA